MWEKFKAFLKRKDIEISVKRYLQDALSAMALGLFGSLLIGVIFDTIGVQTANLFGDNVISAFCVEVGAQETASGSWQRTRRQACTAVST